jgi:hypothetical protein
MKRRRAFLPGGEMGLRFRHRDGKHVLDVEDRKLAERVTRLNGAPLMACASELPLRLEPVKRAGAQE